MGRYDEQIRIIAAAKLAELRRRERLAAAQTQSNVSLRGITNKASDVLSAIWKKTTGLFTGAKRSWKKLKALLTNSKTRFNADCPICTDKFEPDDETFLLKCSVEGGHVYHLDCLQQMIATGHGATWNRCSICHAEIFRSNARDSDIPPELRDANRRRRQRRGY